jgi:hypothetical protein
MFSGIGIVVVMVGIISQNRIKSLESRLEEISKKRESRENIDEDKKS